MKNFFWLYESAVEDRLSRVATSTRQQLSVPYPENYIRQMAAIHSVEDVNARINGLARLMPAMTKQVESWVELNSSDRMAGPLRQSWLHIPEVFNEFRQRFAAAGKAAIQKWSSQVIGMVGEGQYQKLYEKYVRPQADHAGDFPISDADREEVNEGMVRLADELRKSFDSSRGWVIGTPSYISPEMAKHGSDGQREMNFTSYVQTALIAMRQDPTLATAGSQVSRLAKTLDDGMYYFLEVFGRVEPELRGRGRIDKWLPPKVGMASSDDFDPARGFSSVRPAADALQKTVNFKPN